MPLSPPLFSKFIYVRSFVNEGFPSLMILHYVGPGIDWLDRMKNHATGTIKRMENNTNHRYFFNLS
jgi:hypothetical protein